MSDWSVVFLGIMAVALVAMAIVQIAVVVAAAKIARQASETLDSIRRDVKPLIDKANRITDEASRATALAAAQVDRIDAMLASATQRVDDTLRIVQGAIVEPVRQGAAVIAAVRAAVGVFRGWQGRHRQTQEDEEALFVG